MQTVYAGILGTAMLLQTQMTERIVKDAVPGLQSRAAVLPRRAPASGGRRCGPASFHCRRPDIRHLHLAHAGSRRASGGSGQRPGRHPDSAQRVIQDLLHFGSGFGVSCATTPEPTMRAALPITVTRVNGHDEWRDSWGLNPTLVRHS